MARVWVMVVSFMLVLGCGQKEEETGEIPEYKAEKYGTPKDDGLVSLKMSGTFVVVSVGEETLGKVDAQSGNDVVIGSELKKKVIESLKKASSGKTCVVEAGAKVPVLLVADLASSLEEAGMEVDFVSKE